MYSVEKTQKKSPPEEVVLKRGKVLPDTAKQKPPETLSSSEVSSTITTSKVAMQQSETAPNTPEEKGTPSQSNAASNKATKVISTSTSITQQKDTTPSPSSAINKATKVSSSTVTPQQKGKAPTPSRKSPKAAMQQQSSVHHKTKTNTSNNYQLVKLEEH